MVLLTMRGADLVKIVENWPWEKNRKVPDELREEFEERAAMLEIDAGFTRKEAEWLAYKMVVLKKKGGA